MKALLTILSLTVALAACSSSGPAPDKKDATVSVSPTIMKPSAPAQKIKCSYDTDCMVQNSCINEKCKLTGTECRFRSDCPRPRGICVNKICEFR